ncbi:MAG: DUF4352 domain-containing protein [Candidatus Coprovivens sp.]
MAKMKTCKACGKEIAKSAKICPNCGKKNGLPGFVKALIIVFIIFGCIVGCVNGCSDSVNDAVNDTKNSYKDVNGKTSFKVNETFENKYEKITMTEVNANFTDYSQYSKPADGKKYVMLKFEVENINEENDELYVSSLSFNAYADGVSVESAYVGNDKYNDLSATVGKGKKAVGYIFYEVPSSASKITVEYNADFWTDGNAIEFIVQE